MPGQQLQGVRLYETAASETDCEGNGSRTTPAAGLPCLLLLEHQSCRIEAYGLDPEVGTNAPALFVATFPVSASQSLSQGKPLVTLSLAHPPLTFSTLGVAGSPAGVESCPGHTGRLPPFVELSRTF